MPVTTLDRYRHALPLQAEDGDTGFLVRLHWTAWVAYFLCAPLVVSGALATLEWTASAEWPMWAKVLIATGVMSVGMKVVVLWCLTLMRRYVIITQENIYSHDTQKLFFPVTATHPTAKVASVTYEVEGLGIFGVRTVRILTEGDSPDLVFQHAAGGRSLEQGIQRFIAPRT